ncbi:MAG: hypothetical protein OEZ24_03935 [Candidatus Bathyarchaeota archaeon]|nr:hypothetical protein [Candidatus Bathyarchaeota archaeon]
MTTSSHNSRPTPKTALGDLQPFFSHTLLSGLYTRIVDFYPWNVMSPIEPSILRTSLVVGKDLKLQFLR